jgi:hypothetical protein
MVDDVQELVIVNLHYIVSDVMPKDADVSEEAGTSLGPL